MMACCACNLVDHACLKRLGAIHPNVLWDNPALQRAIDDAYLKRIRPLLGKQCLEDICERVRLRQANTPPDPDTFASADTGLIARLEPVIAAYTAYYFDLYSTHQATGVGPLQTSANGFVIASDKARNERRNELLNSAEIYATDFLDWWKVERVDADTLYTCWADENNVTQCSTTKSGQWGVFGSTNSDDGTCCTH